MRWRTRIRASGLPSARLARAGQRADNRGLEAMMTRRRARVLGTAMLTVGVGLIGCPLRQPAAVMPIEYPTTASEADRTVVNDGASVERQVDATSAFVVHAVERLTLRPEGAYGTKIAISPDGATLAIAVRDRLSLWDTMTGERRVELVEVVDYDPQYRWRGELRREGPPPTFAVEFSPDSRYLARAQAGKVGLYDVQTGQLLWRASVSENYAETMAFSPDGRLLAWTVDNSRDPVAVHDVGTGNQVAALTADRSFVFTDVAFTADGSRVVAGSSEEDAIVIWGTRDWRVRAKVPTPGGVERIAASPTAPLVAYATSCFSSIPCTVGLVETTRGDVVKTGAAFAEQLLFSSDGAEVVFIGNGRLTVWDGTTGALEAFSAVPGRIRIYSSAAGGGRVATAGNRLVLWDLPTGQPMDEVLPAGTTATGVALSADGRVLATANEDGSITLWTLEAGARPVPDVPPVPPECSAPDASALRGMTEEAWQAAAFPALPEVSCPARGRNRGQAPPEQNVLGLVPSEYSAAMTPGGCAIVWSDSRDDRTGMGYQRVRFRRVGPEEPGAREPVDLSGTLGQRAYPASAAVDDGWLAAWWDNETHEGIVYAQALDSSGAALCPPVRVLEGSSGFVRIVATSAGAVVIDEGSVRGVAANGAPLGLATPLPVQRRDLAVAWADGRLVMAWADECEGGRAGIAVVTANAIGSEQGPRHCIPVNVGDEGQRAWDVSVAWTGADLLFSYRVERELLVVRVSPAFEAIGAPWTLPTHRGEPRAGSLVVRGGWYAATYGTRRWQGGDPVDTKWVLLGTVEGEVCGASKLKPSSWNTETQIVAIGSDEDPRFVVLWTGGAAGLVRWTVDPRLPLDVVESQQRSAGGDDGEDEEDDEGSHWMGPAGERCSRSQVGVAVDLTYRGNGRFTFDGIELVEGFPDRRLQPEWGSDVFEARVIGYDRRKLISFRFGAQLWFYGNPTVLERKPVLLIFPHCPDGRWLDILDREGDRKLRVDLSEFATCDRDGRCDEDIGEDAEQCPSDCDASDASEAEAEEEPEPGPVERPDDGRTWRECINRGTPFERCFHCPGDPSCSAEPPPPRTPPPGQECTNFGGPMEECHPIRSHRHKQGAAP